MSKHTRKENPDRLPLGKFFAWRMGAWSMAANFIIMGYVTIYCTDTLLMPPALVGTLLMLSKIVDAIGELFAGYIVDRTHFRFGKGRTWDLCFIGLWLSTILMYSAPADAGLVVKSIWVVCMYSLVMSVFQTMIAAGGNPYTIRAFANTRVIVKLQSYGGVVGTLLSSIVSISFPMVMGKLATSPKGWTTMIAIYAIPLMFFGLIRFFCVKEIYPVEEKVTEPPKFRDMWETAKSNKYIWVVFGINTIAQLLAGMGAATYYFTYIVGDIAKLGTLQSLTLVLLFVMFIFPKFIKKYSMSTLITAGACLGILGGVINFFAGANMGMLAVGFVCTGIAALPTSYIIPVMILKCGEYNAARGQRRMDGTMSAINNFGSNFGSALGSFLIGVILQATGYVPNAAAQPEMATFMIRALNSLIPAALYVVMIVLSRKFTVEKDIETLKQTEVQ